MMLILLRRSPLNPAVSRNLDLHGESLHSPQKFSTQSRPTNKSARESNIDHSPLRKRERDPSRAGNITPHLGFWNVARPCMLPSGAVKWPENDLQSSQYSRVKN